MTGPCWTDVCHVLRPKRVLFFVVGLFFKGFGREGEAGRSVISTTDGGNKALHTDTHQTQLSHMDMGADIHMHTRLDVHSRGGSHVSLSGQHRVKQYAR